MQGDFYPVTVKNLNLSAATTYKIYLYIYGTIASNSAA